MQNKQKEKKDKPESLSFSKEALVNSARFADRRDALSAALEEGRQYTPERAETCLRKYMKGKV